MFDMYFLNVVCETDPYLNYNIVHNELDCFLT